jgi:hypothetical protein
MTSFAPLVRTGGVALMAVIACSRDTDGFRDGPGEYQTTPGWNGLVVEPGFRFATPLSPTIPLLVADALFVAMPPTSVAAQSRKLYQSMIRVRSVLL